MSKIIEPIKKSRLSDEVITILKTMIVDGTFKTGDQFPSERELATQFQVSRVSIREALRALTTLGLISTKVGVGGGTFVKKISIDALLDPFSEILGNEKDLIIEMLEFRKLIETEITRLAASRRTDDDLRRLDNSVTLMKEEIENGGIGIKGDTAFHDALASACHNSVFEKMVLMSRGLLVRTRQTSLMIKGQSKESLRAHKAILAAIKREDGELAAKYMMKHIVKAQENASQKTPIAK